MAEQKYTPTTNSRDLPPVEGRIDIAADLEEEQRNAYSAHHVEPSTRAKEAIQDQQREKGNQYANTAILPPVEGRSDIAADLEEEQRNAYSPQHPKSSAPANQGYQQAR